MKFKTINEAVSPTMPNWLKPMVFKGFVDKSTGSGYGNFNKWKDKALSYSKKGYDINSRLASGKSFSGNNLNTYSLFDALQQKGIDLNSVEFKTGDIPKKSTDEKLTDPRYQCFFLIEKDDEQQIYAPGLNDKETSIIDPWKTFKYISYAKIKPYIKDFCYVDLTENPTTHDIRQNKPRPDRNATRVNDKNLGKFSKYPYMPDSNYDKSGYYVDKDKYKKVLAKNRAQNYDKILQDMRDKIIDAKESIQNRTKSFDAFDENTYDNVRDIQHNYGYLRDLIDRYNNIVRNIESYKNNQGLDKEAQKERIAALFTPDGNDYEYRMFNKVFNNLNSRLEKYKPTYLDW